MSSNPNGPGLQEILQQFESQTEPIDEMEVTDAIHDLYAKRGKTPLSKAEMAEGIAFSLAESEGQDHSVWGTYYGPANVFISKDGQRQESPDLKNIDEDMIKYWSQRADQARHPVLRARYADVVWDLSKKVIGKRAGIRFAHIAIDSTLDGIRLNRLASHARHRLRRALNLSLSIKDQERVGKAQDAIIAYEQRTAEDDKLGTWGIAYDLLIEDGKPPLKPEQEQGIIADLERHLAAAAAPEKADGFAAENSALRLARYYQRKRQSDEMRRVLRLYAQAWLEMAKTVMPILASRWLEQVYRTLKYFEVHEEATAVEVQLRTVGARSGENLIRVQHKMEIPGELLTRYVEGFTAGTITDCLIRIASVFLPDPEKAREEVLEDADKYQLLSLFTSSFIDARGRTVAQVGSVEEDLDGHVVRHIAKDMGYRAGLLRAVIDGARGTFSLTEEQVLQFLYESPAFTPDREPLLAQAVDCYLRGDFIAAVHIMLPQIEAAVRNLVEIMGGPVYDQGKHGGLSLRSLGGLLQDARIQKSLGTRIVTYLQVLLTDQRGWNLRNDVSHGIPPANHFGAPMADRLFHVLLVLGLVRRASEQAEAGQPGGVPENSGGAQGEAPPGTSSGQ